MIIIAIAKANDIKIIGSAGLYNIKTKQSG